MAIEGSLHDVSLADICQLLGMSRKTGCLTVTDRSNFGYIYFAKGRVIHASVLDRPDRLGELLVRNHVITRKDLSRAMEVQARARGRRLGEILMEQGSLEEDALRTYIELQVEEAVYHLFAWSQGSFHFDPDQRPDEEATFLVDINPDSLLLEGARRVDEWSVMEKKIPSLDVVFQLDKEPDDSELTNEQRKILPLIDGVRTAEEIMNEAGLVEFGTGKALYGLIQAGFVSRAGERTTVAETRGDARLEAHLNLGGAFYRSGMMEDASREFEGALSIDPDQARAHFMMALIALRAGRFDDALRWLDGMPEAARSSAAVQRNRALALELTGRYPDALQALETAGKARPDDPDVHLLKGIVHLKAKDADSALEELRAYRASPSLKKPPAIYYAYLVLAAAVTGDLDYAVAVGREGLEHYPKSGPILVNTGAVLERHGQMEAAEALYKRAVAATPPPAQAHKNLGDQAYARGDTEGARTQYELAVRLAPRLGDDVYLRLGTLAFQENDRDVALLLWRRALELNPRNGVARANLEVQQGA